MSSDSTPHESDNERERLHDNMRLNAGTNPRDSSCGVTPRRVRKRSRSVSIHINGAKNGIRSKITKLRNMLNSLTQLSPTDRALASNKVEAVFHDIIEFDDSRPAHITNQLELSHASPEEIAEAVSAYHQYKHSIGYDSVLENYHEIMDAGCDFSELLSPPSASDPTPAVAYSRDSIHTGLKLPGVTIPKFAGDPLEYKQFIRSFDTHIDSNPKFSDLDKYELLSAHLTGEAYEHIKLLGLDGADYYAARSLLTKYYDNQVSRDTALLDTIESLKPATNSSQDMASFIRRLSSLLRGLHSKGDPRSDLPVRYLVRQKVPEIYFREVKRTEGKRASLLSIDELFDALLHEVSNVHLSEDPSGNKTPDVCPLQTHVYVTRPSSQNRPNPAHSHSVCFFCRQNHSHADCPSYPTPCSKRAFLLSQRRAACWICLSTAHRSRSCTLPRCSSCSKEHALFLCDHKSRSQSVVPSNNAVPVPDAIPVVSLSSLNMSRLSNLLPVTMITVNNSCLEALFDSGSQCSLIDEKIASDLNLQVITERLITVKGVSGTGSPKLRKVYAVPISVLPERRLTIPCIGLTTVVGEMFIPQLQKEDIQAIRSLHPLNPLPVSGFVRPKILLGVDDTHIMELDDPNLKDQILSEATLESRAVDMFDASVQKVKRNGRLEVKFPFHCHPSNLGSNNYTLAFQRMRQLYMRHKDTSFWDEYVVTINRQLQTGILEEVASQDTRQLGYFIPHTAVVKPSSSTTKLRVVLDASSHTRNAASLNQLLLPGPTVLPDLRQIYVRFRIHSQVVMSDIEKAFHQVELNPAHRKYTMIIWLKNTDRPPSSSNIRILQHTRLPFGVTSSAFLLAAALKFHLREIGTPLSQEVLQSTYVDNLIITRDSDTDLASDCERMTAILGDIGMNLREFTSNNAQVLKSVHPSRLSKLDKVSALGLRWNIPTDSISLQPPPSFVQPILTRRAALSVLSSFYDPLGLYAPSILYLRLLMNEIWTDATLYDLPVDPSLGMKFKDAAQCMGQTLESHSLPRMVLPDCKDAIHQAHSQLDAYADASALAVGVCIYLRSETQSGILLGKAMTSPKGSIPRLELVAMVVAMEIVVQHIETLKDRLSSIHFYSDSTTVLQWIFGRTPPQPIFVLNRLRKMSLLYTRLSNILPVSFHHVDGNSNPADIASRGMDPSSLVTSKKWWHGPRNRHSPKSYSQAEPFRCLLPQAFTSLALTNEVDYHSALLNPSATSSLRRLFLQARGIIVVLQILQQRLRKKGSEESLKKLETAFPILITESTLGEKAEYLVVLRHQAEYRDSIQQSDLDTIIDSHNLVRLRGRFPRTSDFPLVIIGHSPFGKLLIREYHELNSHSGPATTLSRIRRRYWPLLARSSIRSVLKSCVLCKRFNARPFSRPVLQTLPTRRLSGSPFSSIGIDEAGPFQRRSTTSSSYYLLVLTCFTTRAVHIEIMDDSSSSQIVLALRRFIALYRVPRVIFLDNLSSHKALRALFSSASFSPHLPPPLTHLCELHHVRWEFITPLSPWQGGMYERMIGMIKSIMNKILRNSKIISYSVLHTIIMETTTLVNSRPLTPIDDQLGTVLTPRHFLFPYPPSEFLIAPASDSRSPFPLSIPAKLRDVWRETDKLLNELWNYWSEEYLNTLRERNLTSDKAKNDKYPRVGEIVLCSNMTKDRRTWHLGVVEEIFPDDVGDIRTVSVRHPDKNVYLRPPCSLYQLEVYDLPHDQ